MPPGGELRVEVKEEACEAGKGKSISITPSVSSTEYFNGNSGLKRDGCTLGGDESFILEATGMFLAVKGLVSPDCDAFWALSLSASSTIWAKWLTDGRECRSFATPDIPNPSSDEASRSLFSVDDPRRLPQKALRVLPRRPLAWDPELALLGSLLSVLERVRCNDRAAKLPLLPGLGSADVPSAGSGGNVEKCGTPRTGSPGMTVAVVVVLLFLVVVLIPAIGMATLLMDPASDGLRLRGCTCWLLVGSSPLFAASSESGSL